MSMARFKHADTRQTLMVPVCLDDQLVAGTFEHALNQIVENHIDLSELSRAGSGTIPEVPPLSIRPAC